MPTRTAAHIEAPTAASTWPTPREINAASAKPTRFRKWHDRALEVESFAQANGGKLPSWVWRVRNADWESLVLTLRELDDLRWVRRMTAA